MKGDFTRDTFDRKKHYSSVLMQQGRVQLDADWNEQARLLLHRLETMAKDLIGYGGGPAQGEAGGGFGIDFDKEPDRDFKISSGRYYVEGMLVENEEDIYYSSHTANAGRPAAGSELNAKKTYLVYLDAWEEFVGPAEDAALREIGLGGADTAGRSKVLWRVRTEEIQDALPLDSVKLLEDFPNSVARWQGDSRGRLKVRVTESAPSDDPCVIPPSNRYRGLENQLYRVEIHRGGVLDKSGKGGPTFKWSRENGSVVFPIAAGGISKGQITLETGGRDPNVGLRVHDWVEIVAGSSVATQTVSPLYQVKSVDLSRTRVEVMPEVNVVFEGRAILRRWDQKGQLAEGGGTVAIREGSGEPAWIPLENGIEIQFQEAKGKDKVPNKYRIGDYWLIPARTASSGQIDWPSADAEAGLPPHGIWHRYAPLAAIPFSNLKETVLKDTVLLRKVIGTVAGAVG